MSRANKQTRAGVYPFSAISECEMASTATRRRSRHSPPVKVSGVGGLSLTSRISGCRCFGRFSVLQSKLRAASIETRAPVPHLDQCTCLATWKIKLLLLCCCCCCCPTQIGASDPQRRRPRRFLNFGLHSISSYTLDSSPPPNFCTSRNTLTVKFMDHAIKLTV